MKLFSALLTVFVSLQALAGLGEDFAALKDSGSNYEIVGTVCEEVTRLRFQEEFPAHRYSVTTGVEYGDGNRTIGELDVVVFENNSQKVVRVAEVKCWKSTSGAIKKAREQRQRFINTINSGKRVYFHSLKGSLQFKRENFVETRDYMAVAQKGSTMSGFERELPYELSELMKLRQMMIECQHNRVCKRP